MPWTRHSGRDFHAEGSESSFERDRAMIRFGARQNTKPKMQLSKLHKWRKICKIVPPTKATSQPIKRVKSTRAPTIPKPKGVTRSKARKTSRKLTNCPQFPPKTKIPLIMKKMLISFMFVHLSSISKALRKRRS